MEDNCQIVSLAHIDLGKDTSYHAPNVASLPVIATRNLVLFPGVAIPIALVRENARRVAKVAYERKTTIGICCQMKPEEETITDKSQVCSYGVFVHILQIFDLPDGSQTAFVRALDKFKVLANGGTASIEGSELNLRVKKVAEALPASKDNEFDVLITTMRKTLVNFIRKTGGDRSLAMTVDNLEEAQLVINTIATHLPVEPSAKMQMLATYRIKERGLQLFKLMQECETKADIANDIIERAREDIDKDQKEAFLRQQMETIQKELYGSEADGAEKLRKQAEKALLPDVIRQNIDKDLTQLRRLNPQHPDYSTLYAYIETILDLPWGIKTPLNGDFATAETILDEDHYGLEKVKDRILEQLAVMMNNPEGKAPILCLVGAPGVGKTSLGQSVARALGRNYQRVSLGGLHDEAEIRGHRRTYIGAMPGRIITALRRAKSSNPVLLLDEVDKIGKDFKGDPAAALLEVLDPEQNCHFHDNYIDVDFDLSNVLFIATANTLQTLPQPLLDRMEVIEISGYLVEEKIEIARRHLIPRIFADHKIKNEELTFSDEALRCIIENYTSESGVRQLEKTLSTLVRKVVLRKMQKKDWPHEFESSDLHEYLGLERRSHDRYEGNEFAGVVTGLAWTAVGGEILFIESSLSQGKGEKLVLTGNLGDVMKESAVIALQYVKSHAETLGIAPALFDKYNLHIHVPEGAIPKDGPSAGITMATSIVSTFKQQRVRQRVAMTGEITLRGKVLPVGGIKEKILAAKRAGITDIILSDENRRDVEDINARYLNGLTFHYAKTVLDVIEFAITPEPVADPINLSI